MKATRKLGHQLLEQRRCLAWTPTLDGTVLTFTGTAGEDTLTNIRDDGAGFIIYDDEGGVRRAAPGGSAFVDLIVIYGNDDDDTIDVGAGAIGFGVPVEFTIFGNDGNDTITGPPAAATGPHFIGGGPGEDILYGGTGNDTINGDDDPDWIEGGAGDDTIHGNGEGDWYLSGDAGNDKVFGDAGDDEVRGGSDSDKVFGGAGSDEVYGESGNDWTFSNTGFNNADQPFFPQVGALHMEGSGGAACDIEDGHIECVLDSPFAGVIGYGGYLDIAAPGVLDDYAGLGWIAKWGSDGTYGSIDMHDDGSFRYSVLGAPPAADTFEYIISDGENDSLPGIAELSLTNPAPVAVNDNYSTSGAGYGNVFNFGTVLANDTGWTPGEHKQVEIGTYTQPTGGAGSVTMNQDGSFTFTRSHNWIGQTTFTYYAHDFVQASASPATVTITLTNPLLFAGEELQGSTAEAVTLEQAQNMMIAAGQSWLNAGVNSATLNAALSGVTLVITDLPGAQLAATAGGVIYVDVNAAGHGWYLNTTDVDFTAGKKELTAIAGSDAEGKVDLLTALRHEVGHVLGLKHNHRVGGIMNDELAAC